ncbi:MAG TPA: formate dehydrogenase subunit delta [Candidatus Acidoferrales bacterium]|jgi:formate dehydrogenase subunit delta|nr:formate dehydrogenase subunit delta [Candidatus Acidoferrales bacterium]
MEPEHMVHMANQIAKFFASYPKDQAVAGVTDHLRQFWEPRMRKQIIEYVAQGGGGLDELAVEAVKHLQ